MSIYAYTGLPGSGKSFDVVKNQILPALKAGRTVVTNIPLHMDKLREVCATGEVVEFPTEQVQAAPQSIDDYCKPGCVVILDEVWRLWPSGQKSNQVPEPFRKLLAEHRHMVDAKRNSMQIVLVTQDLAQIGAFARQLVEMTFHHTKLSHVGASGSYRIDVYQGPISGPNPPRGNRLREVFGRYDPAVFALYQSHTMSQSDTGGANEATLDTRANVWKRPMLYVGLAAVVAAVAWGIPATRKAFKAEEAVLPVSARRQVLPDPAAVPVAVHSARGRWRLAGVVEEAGAARWAFVTDGAVTLRLPFGRYCVQVVEQWPVCDWGGEQVTPYTAPHTVMAEPKGGREPAPETLQSDNAS